VVGRFVVILLGADRRFGFLWHCLLILGWGTLHLRQ